MENRSAAKAPAPSGNTLVARIAEMVASDLPGAEIACLSLGSCLAVIVHDPIVKVGGILNFMLPDSSINPARARESPFMFVDTGVPLLLEAVLALGAEKSRLLVKVAGGAQFLDDQRTMSIGQRNLATLMQVLQKSGVKVTATDVGGRVSRNLRLTLSNGRLTIQTPAREPYLL